MADTAASRLPFLEWLVATNALTALLAERVARVQAETLDRVGAILLKLGLLPEESLAERFAHYCRLERLDAGDVPPEPLVLDPLNPEFLRARELVPLRVTGTGVEVAQWDALDDYALRALAFALQRPVISRIGTRGEVQRALEALYPHDSTPDPSEGANVIVEDEEVDRLKDLASDAPVIRLVQRLIDEAVRARASDIHLEPSEKALHVRLRLDGLLRELESHPRSLAASVVSRVKVMAGLDIAERRLPQDGRIRVSIQGKEIDFRVATSPTLHGESVVLRILDRQDVALDFDALGFGTWSGGSFSGRSELTPGAVSAYANAATARNKAPLVGLSTLTFHELGHETHFGEALTRKYPVTPSISWPRERGASSAGSRMSEAVGAPFDCSIPGGCE